VRRCDELLEGSTRQERPVPVGLDEKQTRRVQPRTLAPFSHRPVPLVYVWCENGSSIDIYRVQVDIPDPCMYMEECHTSHTKCTRYMEQR
jgi:hypothetical protein